MLEREYLTEKQAELQGELAELPTKDPRAKRLRVQIAGIASQIKALTTAGF